MGLQVAPSTETPPPPPVDEATLQARLDGFVAALRHRRRRQEWSATLLLGGGLLLLATLGCALGAGALPSGTWQALLALLAVSAIGFVVVRHRYALRPRSDVSLLRDLAAEHDAAALALLALAELEAQPGRAVDRAMIRLFRRRVAALLDGHQASDWLPARRLLGSGLVAALAVVGWLTAILADRALLAAGLVDLRTAADDRALPSKEALLRQLVVELEPPAYTGLARRPLGDSTGNVRALAGSTVHLRALPRGEAKRMRIVWAGSDPTRSVAKSAPPSGRMLLGKDSVGFFETRLRVEQPTRYHFELERDGVWWKEPVERRIELEVDQPPRVELKAAADLLELEVARPIELAYSVEDDYGLTELVLEWQPEGGAIDRRVLGSLSGPKAQAKLEWDLRELKVPSGKRVSYWLLAKDNNTQPGPGVGKSRILTFMLRSAKQDHDRTLANQKELLEQAIKVLADRLERPSDSVDTARALHGALPNLAAAVRQNVAALEKDKSARRDLGKRLTELAERLEKLAAEEDRLLGGAARHDKLGSLALKIIDELETDVLLLEGIVGRERLEEMAAIAQELKQTKEQLKQLLAEYKRAPTDEKRRAIERQLAEIEKRLAELQRKAMEAAREVPDEFVNREALESQTMESQVEKIRRMLDKGDTEAAIRELEKLSSEVDQMAKQMDQETEGFRNERFGADEKRLAELENELSELSHEESEIKSETSALRESMRQRAEERLQQKQGELKKIADDVARLKKLLDETPQQPLPQIALEELQRTREEAGQLERAMKPLDLDEAQGKAQALRGDLRAMKRTMDEPAMQMMRGDPAGARKAAQKLGEAEGLAESIQKRLSELAPRPGEQMTPGEREQLQSLDRRQQATRRRLEALQRQQQQGNQTGAPGAEGAEGQGKGEPIPGLDKSLGEAGRRMQGAEGQLRGGKPREAMGEESQALEALQQAQQQVQRERRPNRQEGRGANQNEPVKIPGAEDYQAPREFREDILDAMKRASPERYKQQIEKYFQELVR